MLISVYIAGLTMARNEILVIGAGLVGSEFANEEGVVVVDRSRVNITDFKQVNVLISQQSWAAVINCAVDSDTARAEQGRGQPWGCNAFRVNCLGAVNIAMACFARDVFLVHPNTDFAYRDTDADPGPFSPDRSICTNLNQMTVYGWTKAMALVQIAELGDKFASIGLSYPSKPGAGFLAKALLEFPSFLTKQFITPTLVPEFVDVAMNVARGRIVGLFNVATPDVTTPYDFVTAFAKARGINREFPKSDKVNPLKPIRGGLDVASTQQALGVRFKTSQEQAEWLAQNWPK